MTTNQIKDTLNIIDEMINVIDKEEDTKLISRVNQRVLDMTNLNNKRKEEVNRFINKLKSSIIALEEKLENQNNEGNEEIKEIEKQKKEIKETIKKLKIQHKILSKEAEEIEDELLDSESRLGKLQKINSKNIEKLRHARNLYLNITNLRFNTPGDQQIQVLISQKNNLKDETFQPNLENRFQIVNHIWELID
ncbi:hypothetical protein M0813_02829 [Anaeramoeba flamelloides]|uniref:Kinetochore protein Spc24 n=1 Tax=Anaeramoeba flamelloides TaxID=1746091 RepID=A0ABQ8YEF3_9EUKA|nr:hypothetical protein M0813_02829 [Anaeramoeba flamelloides]